MSRSEFNAAWWGDAARNNDGHGAGLTTFQSEVSQQLDRAHHVLRQLVYLQQEPVTASVVAAIHAVLSQIVAGAYVVAEAVVPIQETTNVRRQPTIATRPTFDLPASLCSPGAYDFQVGLLDSLIWVRDTLVAVVSLAERQADPVPRLFLSAVQWHVSSITTYANRIGEIFPMDHPKVRRIK